MSFSPLLQQLISAFRCLPGVGQKSAQRMAFHVLERDKDGGQYLAQILSESIKKVGRCIKCRTLSELTICSLCANANRDSSVLCVVESPADVLAIEQTAGFRGLYFVLMGHLSPIDGIGPEELGIDIFSERLNSGEIEEVILATNPTVEGEATAYFLAEMTKARGIKTTRIAHGVPMGGELEHIDGSTLSRALQERGLV